MLRIAIVGCGKIADQHAEQIVVIPGCKIVGVCDREELMARQLRERRNVESHFIDVQELLEEARPDVVHITSPPRSHYPLGKLCLEAGCHVYIEKPFTVNLAEADDLVALAQRKNLKLTVGHNAQFSHAAIRMRQLVETGYLGRPTGALGELLLLQPKRRQLRQGTIRGLPALGKRITRRLATEHHKPWH